MDPPRAKPKRLNKVLLSDIAATAAEHHTCCTGRENNVAGLYVCAHFSHVSSAHKSSLPDTFRDSCPLAFQLLDRRFNGKLLRHLESVLHGRNKKSTLVMESKLFSAVLEHSGLTTPTMALTPGFSEISKRKLTGTLAEKFTRRS